MHHSYLYSGPLSTLPHLTEDARKRFGFEGPNNPDLQVRKFEKFGIEEARELTKTASLRSVSGRSLYIVAVSQITSEAQQALLKLFEEPQEGAIFLLLAPHGSIIPTLRSRFLDYPWKPQESVFQSAGAFLAASQKTRGAEIVKLLKDEDGLRERVRDFLNALEQALYPMLQKSSGKKEIREGLEDIARIRSYANDRSPSLKMLLEHLALSLPMLS
jgi:hypothetical protein